jgi:hypothetical protein
LTLRIKNLDAQQHHRGTTVPSEREVRMKVVVQSDAHPPVIARRFQYESVLGLLHSEFRNVDGVEAIFAENHAARGASP